LLPKHQALGDACKFCLPLSGCPRHLEGSLSVTPKRTAVIFFWVWQSKHAFTCLMRQYFLVEGERLFSYVTVCILPQLD